MQRMMNQKLEREAQRIDQLSLRLQHAIPNPKEMRQRQNQLQERLTRVWQEKMRYWRQQQEHYLFQIEALNPQRTLERGYSLILDGTKAVRDPKELKTSKEFTIAMAHGQALVTLENVLPLADE